MRVSFFSLLAAASLMGLLAASNSATTKGKPAATQKSAAAKPVEASPAKAAGSTDATFDTTVKPILAKSCTPCHNDRMASGSLSLTGFLTPASLTNHRDEWERILQKIRTGEMPPKGMPRPAQPQVEALMGYVQGEFEKADKLVKPDPGRVTARRLNRVEYTNTIRDLLAIDYRADKNFPADDSGYGFDNIGDVLTISPVLMEKYLQAAEKIAASAVGADPLPKKPLEFEYHSKDKQIRRLDRSTIEATHNVEYDGEYLIRIGLPGERAKDAAPVTLNFWMDGKLIHSQKAETKPSGLEYFNPYSEEEFRVVLPAGDHVFRAGFTDDPFVKTFATDKEAYDQKKNKFLNMIKFIGPFPAKVEKESRKKILICDPSTGDACVQRIVSTLARRAYRRPVKPAEVAGLMKFVRMAKAEGQSVEQGIQLALTAMLVSPHFLFRVERDPNPNDAANVHPISELELASRLSYFLWSSMPDDELLTLAETGKLRANLEPQIRRMLRDQKSAALADNFAGQWLETRNLDQVKPDPQKFPDWGPELREAMKAETRLFFETVLRENLPMTEFLNARFTFLNERLAKHYGIEGVTGPDFRRVDLTTPERGGILSHGSVLTVSSYPTRTSPVIRGKYVLQNILGTPPPPPPPDVPALDEEKVGNAGSLRQQMEQHRTNAVCASCHSRMDVLGFGLENYDAIGRWRTKDGKFAIDSSGTLPNGKSFTTPAELRELLKNDLPDFSRALTEKMLTYSLGRGLERYDRRTVDQINKTVAGSGYKFQTLVFEIARSLPFQSRRGEVSRAPSTTPTKSAVIKTVAQPQEAAARPKEVATR
jgi:cytochrome c553